MIIYNWQLLMRNCRFCLVFHKSWIPSFSLRIYDDKWKPKTFSTNERSSRDLRHLEYVKFINSHFLSFGMCCYDVFFCCLEKRKVTLSEPKINKCEWPLNRVNLNFLRFDPNCYSTYPWLNTPYSFLKFFQWPRHTF